MTKRIFAAFIVLIFTVGCSVLPAPTEQVASGKVFVDCVNDYDFVITKDNINEPISPYKIYFHFDSEDKDARKKIRLIIRLDVTVHTAKSG